MTRAFGRWVRGFALLLCPAGLVACGGSTSSKKDGGVSFVRDAGVKLDAPAIIGADTGITGDGPRGGTFIDARFSFGDARRPGDAAPASSDAGGRADASGMGLPDAGGGSQDAGSQDAVFFPFDASDPADAAASNDASAPVGGAGGSGGSGGSGGFGGTGGSGGMGGSPADAGSAPDLGIPPGPCVVELRAIGAPALTALVAGLGATATLRAEVVGRTDPTSPTWRWNVTFMDGSRPALLTRDGGLVQWTLQEGDYAVSASTTVGGRECASGTMTATARDPGRVLTSKIVRVTATPPADDTDVAILTRGMLLTGGAVGENITMVQGTEVAVNPVSAGGLRTISSYVRIANPAQLESFEGFARTAAFSTRLRGNIDDFYDVLIVPTGPGGAGVGAEYAPLFVPGLAARQISTHPMLSGLSRGIAVRGRLTRGGVGVAGARVVLRGTVLASTVAATDADGAYEVLVQPGRFAFVASPPPDSGLPEVAQEPQDLMVTGDLAAAPTPRVDFAWFPVSTGHLALAVQGFGGQPVVGARVRVHASLENVGAISLAAGTRSVPGNVHLEAITGSDGTVSFSALPWANYTVTVLPDLGRDEAITTTMVRLDAATPALQTVTLVGKVPLAGRLTGVGDLSNIRVTATDVGTDVLTSPVITSTTPDGSFALLVSPRRRYLVLAQPPAESPHGRTFVGHGPLEATALMVTQKLRTLVPWSARVSSAQRPGGIPGVAIKVYCHPDAPDCPDPRIPIAEGVSRADGTFSIGLPDPMSR